MLATVELQVSATTFAKSVMAALRQNPQCLPPATLGLQLQRVRLKNAAVRNGKPTVFRKSWEVHAHDQGLGWEDINGKQVQLVLDVTIDVTQTATIVTNPNKLIAAEFSADATVSFELDCRVSGAPGWIEIVYYLDDIQPTGAMPPATSFTPQWVKDQLTARFTVKPFKLDLSGSIPKGAHFANAGLAMDAAGTLLAVRAELSANVALSKWRNFHNGNVDNHLGASAWSVFAVGDQLEYTLGNKAWDALRGALGGEKDKLISVGAEFVPQPGKAVFILTPYFKVPVLGTEDVPISVALWIDTVAGNLIIDLDGYGIRNLVSSFLGTVGTILSIFVPILGPFVSSFLNDAVGGLMSDLSSLGASELQSSLGEIPGAAKTATLKELPGQPFRYRATLPLPTPPLAHARIQELITSPTGFALRGSWTVLNFVEGELDADVFGFGWQMPKVACGSSGEAVLRDIEVNPKKYAWLLSRVELAVSGTAKVRLCSVSVLSLPDPSAGVQVKWAASTLPTTIDIVAPASLVDLNLNAPIELEVRTTIGVFRVQIQPPPPLTEADVNRLRSGVRMQLQFCDTKIKAAWFDGEGRFDLDWIVDPLIDPDRELELVRLEVSGLLPASKVVLSGSTDATIGVAPAGLDGIAQMQFAWLQGSPTPRAMVQLGGLQRSSPAAGTAPRGVALYSQRFERQGALRLSSPALGVAAAPGSSARFLVVQNEGFLVIDASEPGKPTMVRRWSAPGLRGVVPVRRGALAYGDAGAFWLDSLEATARPEGLQRAVVADASASRDYVALVIGGHVEIWNDYGAPLATLGKVARPCAVMAHAGELLIASETDLTVFDVEHPTAPRRIESMHSLRGSRFVRSGIDGTIYLKRVDGTFAQLARDERGWSSVAEFPAMPWVARVARSGRMVLHLGDGVGLNLLRSVGPPEMVAPVSLSPPKLMNGI